jgi:competence protein ComGC
VEIKMDKNKKKLIILIGIIIAIMTIIVVIFLFNMNKKDAVITQQQWDTPNQETLVKNAVEAYTLQDVTELNQARNQRLKKYFAENSPVYAYEPDNFDLETQKTTGKVVELTPCEEQEGDNLCLLAKTQLTYFSKERTTTLEQTYWVTVIKEYQKNFKVYDIGVWIE